jgi:hypothetical protein
MPSIEAVNVRVERKDYELEDLITIGQELREKKDNISWEMGDLAIEVTRSYGPKALEAFSKGVGIQLSTIRRYRDVAKAYPVDFRQEVAMLSWSHFRTVAARDDRFELLKRAHDENWSIDKMMAMVQKDQTKVIDDGKFVPPKPEMMFCTICRKWYIVIDSDLCPSKGQCVETK